MKNILLFSSILAAGTLAANAEVTLLSGFSRFVEEGSVISSDLGTKSLTVVKGAGTVSDGILSSSASAGTSGRTYVDLSSLGLSSNYTVCINFKNATSLVNQDAIATLDVGTAANNASIILARYETGGKVGIADNGATGSRPDSALSSVVNFTTEGSLTFSVKQDGSYSIFVTDGGTTEELTWSGKTHTENLLGLYLGSWPQNFAGTDQHQCAVSVKSLSVWSGAATLSDISSIIPEPSAFGLLAGIGALALAGTRRRRRQ